MVLEKRRKYKKFIIPAACLLVLLILLHFFPVYRALRLKLEPYDAIFTAEDMREVTYIGSYADRKAVQPILELAETAMSDYTHTAQENEQTYGVLAYCAIDSSFHAASTSYSLKLWTAHLNESDGYLWVYYHCDAYDAKGNLVTGGEDSPARWTLEKDAAGQWVVTDYKEFP